MRLPQTPSQTVGPFFPCGLTPRQYGYAFPSIAGSELCTEATEGERILVMGQVFDGAGDVIPDAVVELWQANARGIYSHPNDPRRDNHPDPDFTGFGRCGTGTDRLNRFLFRTVKPGRVDKRQAPHLNLIVLMRGLLDHLYTRVYFPDEESANAADPVLSRVPRERRGTLIARKEASPEGSVYRFDIHMQGEAETVFFDV